LPESARFSLKRRRAEKTAGPPPETAYKTFLGSFCEFYDKM
jgi:hypothetical protein